MTQPPQQITYYMIPTTSKYHTNPDCGIMSHRTPEVVEVTQEEVARFKFQLCGMCARVKQGTRNDNVIRQYLVEVTGGHGEFEPESLEDFYTFLEYNGLKIASMSAQEKRTSTHFRKGEADRELMKERKTGVLE